MRLFDVFRGLNENEVKVNVFKYFLLSVNNFVFDKDNTVSNS